MQANATLPQHTEPAEAMPTLPQSFIADSPWWKDATAIRADHDLLRLASAPVRFEHPVPFDLDTDAVYTLRGPRQVGKSTLLKRIVRVLLEERGVQPRRILYTDVEGAGYNTALRLSNAIATYVQWARESDLPADARLYIFLDEVTGVKDWGAAVRTLYRQGVLQNVTMLATGSHALDIARGGELAPGRRGEQAVEHADWILMPLGFRDFVAAHDPALAGALPAMDVADPHQAYGVAQQLQLYDLPVRALFDRYLLTGGYPHAMSEEFSTGKISRGVYQTYRDSITGQMRRAGLRAEYFRELVSWAGRHRLGQEFSWNDVSADTDIGSKDTARRYMEDAEHLFLWHILYRGQSATDSAPALRSPKKLYPADPFAWHVLASWAAGHPDPWPEAITRLADPTTRGVFVEAVAGDHFMRGYGRFAWYHRADAGRGSTEEIDMVLHRHTKQARLEIKYRARITTKHRRHLAQYGGGILATVDHVEWYAKDNVAAIPLHLLLAGYDDRISLYPAHLV